MKVFSPSAAIFVGAVLAVSSIGHVDGETCAALTSPFSATIPQNTSKTLTATASECTAAGSHPYISSLTVVPKAGSAITTTDYAVTFAYGDGDSATEIKATSGDCDFTYTDVGKSKTVTSAVVATITCSAESCDVDYKATYACYTKPAAYLTGTISKTWRRKAATGDGCTPSADACFAVCSKSYAVTATTADSEVTLSLASQVKSDTCTCATAVTAVAEAEGLSAAGNKVTLDYDVGGVTVVTTQADAKKCTATYVEGSYNPFMTGKTYTRGTYDPSTCASATDCEFKCNAELALTVANDKVTGKSSAVTSCTCTDLTATVADDQVTSGTATGVTYSWKSTATGFDLTTVKGSTTCKAPYTVKAASGGSETNSTAPSPPPTSGVSVNTIWAVAATAVIAVAGAFVMV